jgi:KDO2-lipid IV(A) lauroyltransferase
VSRGARITAALERGLHRPLGWLPTTAGTRLGEALGHHLLPRLFPIGTARARAAFAALRPDLDPAAATRAAWANLAATVAEMPRLLRLPAEGRLEIEGAGHLRAAHAAGRGVICAGLHTGNSEALGLAIATLGLPIAGVAARQDSAFRDRIADATRRGYGARPIPAERDAARQALAALRAGAVLLLYVDEHVGGPPRGPSLGRGTVAAEANLVLAGRLARLSGAAVVPGFVERLAGRRGRFRASFLPPVALPAPGDRLADAMAIDAAVDPVVRALLPQWHHVILWREAPLSPPRSAPPSPPHPISPSRPA